jgi:hypothetical protein
VATVNDDERSEKMDKTSTTMECVASDSESILPKDHPYYERQVTAYPLSTVAVTANSVSRHTPTRTSSRD